MKTILRTMFLYGKNWWWKIGNNRLAKIGNYWLERKW